MLLPAEIERLAHESGAIRRRRKVDASAMLSTVLLGFGTERERPLAGLRRTERLTGKSLVPSSFYDRFSTELVRTFRAVLRELMTMFAASEVRYGGVLEGFRNVLAADATVVKVHRLLARRILGTRKNSSPAAAKLHLVMSSSGTAASKVKVARTSVPKIEGDQGRGLVGLKNIERPQRQHGGYFPWGRRWLYRTAVSRIISNVYFHH